MTAAELRLPERYVILSQLGAGAMGVVYKAKDTSLDKIVAIKVLKTKSSDDQVVRFQNEARATAQLEHASILSALDFGTTEDGTPYLVVDYLEGEPLAEYLKDGPLPVARALWLMSQVASGLAHAHGKGILHRDLKPTNVFVSTGSSSQDEYSTYDISAKILDFGLAKFQEEDQKITATGAVMGTPLYMSPEQARGEPGSELSDIYSFGCVMFETLTGAAPIRGETSIETLSLKLEEEAPRLEEKNDSISYPEELEELVAICLQKDPASRFPSASELADQIAAILDSLLEEEDEDSSDATTGDTSNVTAKAHSFTLWFVIAATLVAVAGMYFLSQSMQPEKKQEVVSRKDSDYVRRVEYITGCIRKGKISLKGTIADPLVCDEPFLRALGAVLESNKQVFNLVFNNVELDGRHLSYLPRDQLTNLTIKMTAIDEATMEEIGNIASLKSLGFHNFNKGSISEKNYWLKRLSSLTRLEKLILEGFESKNFGGLRTLSSLEKLELIGTEITDSHQLGEELASVTNLSRLTLRSLGPIDSEFFRSLSKNISIKFLDLEAINPSETSLLVESDLFEKLEKLKRMKNLSLTNMPRISDRDWRQLHTISQLEYLRLRHMSNIPIAGWQQIPELENLLHLELKSIKTDESIWNSIGKCKKLGTLILTELTLPDYAWSHIEQLKDLQLLVLNDCQYSGSLAQEYRSKHPTGTNIN